MEWMGCLYDDKRFGLGKRFRNDCSEQGNQGLNDLQLIRFLYLGP